jgi:LacI family transcriptional regulator
MVAVSAYENALIRDWQQPERYQSNHGGSTSLLPSRSVRPTLALPSPRLFPSLSMNRRLPHPSSERVTMREIARRLGVSHVTVSLALSGNPRIPLARRQQIKDYAEQVGYRPDPTLSALIRYRLDRRQSPQVHAAIAWLNLWPEPSDLRKRREFDGYWRGAKEVAESRGYHLEEFCPGPKLGLKRIERILRTRNIPGLLLPPAPQRGMLGVEDLDWGNFSVVSFGHSHSRLPVHMVTADQAADARLALHAARDRGYRRIGFATTAFAMSATMFTAGFLQAQAGLPESDRVPLFTLTQNSAERPLDLLRQWIERHQPDAIITDFPEMTRLLAELRIAVPAELGLAALSVLDGNADAGINQNAEEIGRVAAETLISLINHHHRGIPRFQRHILVEGFWTDGSTMPHRT